MLMLRRMLRSSVFALFALSLVGSGCGKSIYVIDIRDNLAKWKGPPGKPSGADEQPAARRPGRITVQVVGTPTMGMLRGLGPDLVPVRAASGDEEKTFKRMVSDDQRVMAGFLVKGVGEAARALLQRHLERYFESAEVRLVDAPTGSGPTLTRMQLGLVFGFYTRTATFSWSGEAGGLQLQATATPPQANAAAHLAWGIPLGLLTFPVGLMIGSGIMSSVYRGIEEDKSMQAIDLAAATMAAQISNAAGAQASAR